MIQTDVLIIGGGFAGVSVAQELEKNGIKTTLVDKKDYFEVTFATLRNVADPEKTQDRARKKYQDFLASTFIQSGVVELSRESALLENGTHIAFKQAVIASGTRYPSMPVAKSNVALDIEARNTEFSDFHTRLEGAEKVLVIGGGVVGVELAGEIAYAFPEKNITLAHNTGALLTGFREKAQRKSLEQLTSLGVEVQFNSRYRKAQQQYVDENTGIVSNADLVFEATGILPNSEFLKPHLSDTLNEHGYIQVNEKLEVVGEKNLYALGDVADVGEAKLGYLAQQQGSYLAKLIIRDVKEKKTKGYKRNPLMALIPTGQKSGVAQLPFAVTTSKFLMNMKQKDLFISKVYKAFGAE